VIKGTGTEGSGAIQRCVLEGPRKGVLFNCPWIEATKSVYGSTERLSEHLWTRSFPGELGMAPIMKHATHLPGLNLGSLIALRDV
jgi:hypothetical protein